ncbi:hypothetical protein JHK84_049928 [Glycine max]|uniref:BED-type domain-containing protein n=1 Tax=Glycine max TaxID=3847 RepID=A0A0R0EZ64_SOYBN|nr:hypothetical protein JHK85_050646 [Glycine max]KAG5094340.1 hypothetical protein JHK84_049928 [Glycine max]KAH1154154.1 hypothetical protein GYH30_049691 [Glycine max]
MFGGGNGSNSSNATTGASLGATSRSKNAPGNRTDIGWKHGTNVLGNGKKVKCNYCSKINNGGIFRFKHHLVGTRWDSEPCASVPEEVKMLMMKVVIEVANAPEKRRKLNSIHEKASGEGVQATLNQLYKKGDKDKVDDQCVEFWYTSVIPFNVIKNPAFAKFCDMVVRYGVGYKPPPYHDIREKLLKRAVEKTDVMLEEFRDEWKKTGCIIMPDGWIDKKRRSICNFLGNSPKGTVFLYSLDTSDISKIANKVLKMLDDVVNFVGEENVVQVITDNAANYEATEELLMQKREHLYWNPCAAHCIDSIFEDFEKHLKKFTNGRDLIRPGMTRFATSYLTLACLHELKASLMSMFSSEEWKTSKFGTSQEGRKVQNVALDSRFWKNVTIGFVYEEMENAKEKIKCNFNNIKKSYEPVWKITDERWDHQLHRPLHAAAYHLNPPLHYEPTFRHDDPQVKEGLHIKEKINLQLVEFHFARELFSMEKAKDNRNVIVEEFAIPVLSLTCSSFGCECNWSSFEMVHTKRRNRLHQQKMNDLVYIESDNEWMTEEGYNDEDEKPQGEGDGGNVELVGDVGGSSNDLVVDAFDLDNLILVEPNDDAQSKEDLDDDGDGDESDDIHGDDPIRGLDMIL